MVKKLQPMAYCIVPVGSWHSGVTFTIYPCNRVGKSVRVTILSTIYIYREIMMLEIMTSTPHSLGAAYAKRRLSGPAIEIVAVVSISLETSGLLRHIC